MKRAIVLVGLGLIGLAGLSAQVPTRPPLADPTQATADLDRRWLRDYASGTLAKGADSQVLARFVLDGAYQKYDPTKLLKVLKLLEEFRDTRPGSKTRGNLSWYYQEGAVNDANAVEFTNRQLLLALYVAGRIGATPLTDELRAFLKRNLEGIYGHQVRLDYTNIALMRSCNLILTGELLGDAKAQETGRQFFESWQAEFKANGAREFLSPTYYEVDLENLGLLFNLSTNAAVRDQAKAALDRFWGQILSHWYLPSFRLGGVHSRDYDRLYGHAGLDRWVAAYLGNETYAFKRLELLAFFAWYLPAPQLRSLTEASNRFVADRWQPNSWFSQWIGRNVSLGTSSDLYFNMDKTPFVINLGSGNVPVINLWMDGRGDYYGYDRILERSGHLKSLHLMPLAVAAQRDAEAIAIINGTSEQESKLETTISLPADADYWLDGAPLNFSHHTSAWKADPNPEGGQVGLRVFRDQGRDWLEIRDEDVSKGVGVSQILPVRAGQDYELSVRGSGGSIALYQNFYGADGSLIGGEHIVQAQPDKTKGNLIVAANRVRAPEGAKTLRTWLYSTTANRTRFVLEAISCREIVAQGKPVELATFDFETRVPFDQEVHPGQTLFVQRQDAVAALRLVQATNVDGQPISFHLINDGLDYGALRLTALQANQKTTTRAASLWYIRVGDGLTTTTGLAWRDATRQVPVDSTRTGSVWQLSAKGIGGPLAIRLDEASGSRTIEPQPRFADR